MPAFLIRWSLNNRVLVLLLCIMLGGWGWLSARQIPLDAIPDLSDVQVIIKTSWPGQSPRIVEDQLTYPITTTMLAVPGAEVVRGYSFFGDSYVYVIFAEDTDPYWARSRVLEYLSQAAASLPAGVEPQLGPDASGVGWIYSYALVDRSGQHDLAQLRSLQDWFLKYELQAVPGVAEVATVGGMVRQYQVVIDPEKLRALNITLPQIVSAIRSANEEVGGSVIEQGEAEYMIRTRGYLRSLEDIEHIPLKVVGSVPVLLRDVAHIQIGPEMRRTVADLDGEGEVTGGIIVMRQGENALQTIAAVKTKLSALRDGLPEGVEIVTTYDRSDLIERAAANLSEKLVEEFIVVALICLLFLFRLRSALVVIISLPLGILVAFAIMKSQGINANIMSLGGIAIAIGTMVDATIVMIENVHKHLERATSKLSKKAHWELIGRASIEVGPALFFSLLIIAISFLPVLALQGQEGRLFSPLAFTKTYAMAAAAGFTVTLVPVLMGYLIRGPVSAEVSNPISRFLLRLYQPMLCWVLQRPRTTLAVALLMVLSIIIPVDRLGSEFMPELFEGDLMYMPTTLPSISIGKARELLQQTNRLIRQTPEVERVFGKVGRADTATDPAPLTMIETTIQLKPREEWRPGLTLDGLIAELDERVQFPGLTNAWVMPIKTRIDMLATGIKTPLGVKIAGADLAVIEDVGRQIEHALKPLPNTASVYAERVTGGRYIEIVPKRLAAARLGFNVSDINQMVQVAVGGINITQTVEGLERYPVNIRFPRERRDDIHKLRELPLISVSGAVVPLSQVADVHIVDGPPLLKSENARLNGWVFIDTKRDVDLGSYMREAHDLVADRVDLPPGYSLTWSGQYEHMQRAEQQLMQLVPFILGIIFILLILIFRRTAQALIVMLSLPFALVGGFWLVFVLGYNLSVAVAVGLIALMGIAAEFGVVMLIYLDNALARYRERNQLNNTADLRAAIIEGAVLRIRPKAMTVAVIVGGLLPIMISHGTGSELMQRIAAPVIGGMITAPLLSLFVMPAIYLLWKQNELTSK